MKAAPGTVVASFRPEHRLRSSALAAAHDYTDGSERGVVEGDLVGREAIFLAADRATRT